MTADPAAIAPATPMLFCAKNLERIGDHVTNIAENAYFTLTGRQLSIPGRRSRKRGSSRRRDCGTEAASQAATCRPRNSSVAMPGAKSSSSTKVERASCAALPDEGRLVGLEVERDLLASCPPAVCAIASRRAGRMMSKAEAPRPTMATGAGSVRAKRTSKAEADRLAGLAETPRVPGRHGRARQRPERAWSASSISAAGAA